MHASIQRGITARPVVLLFSTPLPALAEEGRRQIEEVIVTAERRESTVSDTSISITAFTGEFIEDFGIRNQEDLQNLVPAAVIEPYDMAIRGVGRNFRSLGGDPGIATYLNGVYSEDFGIASTEGGLFDIERIEFVRGPQGTLYGRNAIGGAVNFINKLPSEEFEGEARVVLGDYSLQEYYGVVSGPLIPRYLQGRLTGVKRTRDGRRPSTAPPWDNSDGA
jgi:iron complex outermembrane receptor protein